MDINCFVEAVTREVMKKMKDLQSLEQIDKKKYLLVCEMEKDRWVKDLDGSDCIIDVVNNENVDLNEYDGVIIPILSNRALANICLGVTCGNVEKTVINALLLGKRVWIFEEGITYRKYIDTANKLFYKIYQDYEKQLISFGIVIKKKERVLGEINNKRVEESRVKEEKIVEEESVYEKKNEWNDDVIDFIDKRLISEGDLRKIYSNGKKSIQVGKKTIISPLAKDFIRIHKMEIIKGEE